MEIDVNVIIKNKVNGLNVLFEEAHKISGKEFKPFVCKDYTYLGESQSYFGEFLLPHFFAHAIYKDVEFRIKNPYPGTIWYWKKDVNITKSEDFLKVQSQLMYDTLNSYMLLLKSENFLQALILFRSYIEYSSQFYACLLDYDFFKKYSESDILDEEYKKVWFNNLRPEKVLSKIKNMHAEINKLLKDGEIANSHRTMQWQMFKPFDTSFRGYLYNNLSALSHGSYSAIKQDKTQLYALVFLCSIYLVESQAVIDELTSVYFKYTPLELFHKWITIEIYHEFRKPNASLYV